MLKVNGLNIYYEIAFGKNIQFIIIKNMFLEKKESWMKVTDFFYF